VVPPNHRVQKQRALMATRRRFAVHHPVLHETGVEAWSPSDENGDARHELIIGRLAEVEQARGMELGLVVDLATQH